EGDGLLHPRGPLAPEIYWRRRLIVLVGALALIFLIVQCAPGVGGDPKKSSSTRSPSPSTSSSAKPTAKSTPKSTAKPSTNTTSTPAATTPAETPSVSESPTTPAAVTECKPPALQLSVQTNAASYAAGVTPLITLTIKNAGNVPCTRDLGAGATELKITSGPDRIWSSDDCVKDAAKKPTVLKAGEVRTVEVTWNRKRSKPTGECVGAEAKSGRYRVQGRLGDLLTGQKSFLLS
ncbi:MAG: hypothetical protein ABIM89_08085, partial [Mycobacteriales bacterium]